MNKLQNDTIAAIATALSNSAISIIKVSGDEAIEIVNSIFKGKDLNKVESHTINYGHIIENDKLIDEVLVSVMKAPKTYTKEDIVEINTHGGIATTNKVLELLLKNGCVPAEPGEFTKRAFLNGRIDLEEAEGIMDLIEAKTDKARDLAINQLSGKVSNLIRNLREDLVQVLANINVNIDYPEYDDVEEVTIPLLQEKIKNIKEKIEDILKKSNNGKIIKEGIKTSIIGKPNVGKSSLLNTLLEEDKAIVTDIEGTTRDIVEGTVNIDGILLNIIDTAGIRDTDNIVEKIGVDKSLELIDNSDLILFVLNNNEEITKEELELLEKIENKNHIIIVNKIDLEKKLNTNLLNNVIYISTKNNEGIDELKNTIKKIFNLEQIEKEDMTYLTSARSVAILKKVNEQINELEKNINNNMPIDMIELDIKNIWNLLGEIIGDTYEEELIDELFSRFCLGK